MFSSSLYHPNFYFLTFRLFSFLNSFLLSRSTTTRILRHFWIPQQLFLKATEERSKVLMSAFCSLLVQKACQITTQPLNQDKTIQTTSTKALHYVVVWVRECLKIWISLIYHRLIFFASANNCIRALHPSGGLRPYARLSVTKKFHSLPTQKTMEASHLFFALVEFHIFLTP